MWERNKTPSSLFYGRVLQQNLDSFKPNYDYAVSLQIRCIHEPLKQTLFDDTNN